MVISQMIRKDGCLEYPQFGLDLDVGSDILFSATSAFYVLPGTLYIHEVHVGDSGRYGCTAGNRGGFKRTEAKLTVKSSRDFVPQYTLSGDSGEETISRTISITLGAAGLYMALVLTLMLYCRVSRARRKAALLGSRSKGKLSIILQTISS